MKVNSNIQGMISQAILSSNEERLAKASERMSSGYMINKAKDNPSGMAISNKMRAQLSSLDRAHKNSKNAVNAVQTADGALNEVHEMLQRMNELAIQASNGTLSDSDREAIQEEADHLGKEITRISKTTTYNSQKLLDGSQALKGYPINNSGVYSVVGYNERMQQGNFNIDDTINVSTDADGKVSFSVTTDFKDLATTPPSSINTSHEDITVYYDDVDNPTKVLGYTKKLTFADGGSVTYSVKHEMAVPAPGGTDTGSQSDMINLPGIGGMKIQTGAEEGQEIQVVIPEVSLRTLGFEDLNGKFIVDMTTEDGATRAIKQIDKALGYVSEARSKIGAYQNRLEKSISNLEVSRENLTESYAAIKDLDMAEGMVEYTTRQVLVQAGTTMLAQANEQPQQALQLLQ